MNHVLKKKKNELKEKKERREEKGRNYTVVEVIPSDCPHITP